MLRKLEMPAACEMGADVPWTARPASRRTSKDACDIVTSSGPIAYTIALYVARPLAEYIVAIHNSALENEPHCSECGRLLDQQPTAHACNGYRNWCSLHNVQP